MQSSFIEGFVKYPDDLPCPQADTDLVPRERRYISDITEVRNMRMFQQEFQATRNRITFIFTEEEARQFREWYENEIIFGGAWFYADWPTLHKDKKIAHRFVGQPKYEWLLGANPGMMGRSSAGVKYGQAPMAVTMYKVTATVELYDPRKVGAVGGNVYTSKIYPYYFKDGITFDGVSARGMPFAKFNDDITFAPKIISGQLTKWIYSSYEFQDKITFAPKIASGQLTKWIYSNYEFDDAIALLGASITEGDIPYRLIHYDYFEDSISFQGAIVISGEKQ